MKHLRSVAIVPGDMVFVDGSQCVAEAARSHGGKQRIRARGALFEFSGGHWTEVVPRNHCGSRRRLETRDMRDARECSDTIRAAVRGYGTIEMPTAALREIERLIVRAAEREADE
jgi:hypothetical protein